MKKQIRLNFHRRDKNIQNLLRKLNDEKHVIRFIFISQKETEKYYISRESLIQKMTMTINISVK